MNVFQGIGQSLSSGESLVLATILARSGSAPRAVGSNMAVRPDGSIIGTIGGGVLEARVRKMAEEVFRNRKALVTSFTLTEADASQLGMVCGGQVRVLIHFLDASDTFQSRFYQLVATAWETNRKGWIVTRVPREDGELERPERGFLGKDGSTTGSLDPILLQDIVAGFNGRQPGVIRHCDDHFLVEPLSNDGAVYIFGAGHISMELAPLTSLVGFRTAVLDDRREYANRERFPSAEEISVLDLFENAMNGLPIDSESYLVIVTRGHAHDKTVLEQALRTKAGYIGMIGSRRKRDAIYRALLEEGFSRTDLDRVHCPIGLDIGAETPEEIAVCIVAELIKARAGKNA